MVKSIAQLIADDSELSELLLIAFKWRGHSDGMMTDHTVNDLAKRIFEKYNCDIEVYT